MSNKEILEKAIEHMKMITTFGMVQTGDTVLFPVVVKRWFREKTILLPYKVNLVTTDQTHRGRVLLTGLDYEDVVSIERDEFIIWAQEYPRENI